MATVTASQRSVESRPSAPPAPRRRSLGRWISDHVVLFVGILVLIYTFVPIGYIIALSFNQPSGKSATAQFESFTWSNWTSICEPEGLCQSLRLVAGASWTSVMTGPLGGRLRWRFRLRRR